MEWTLLIFKQLIFVLVMNPNNKARHGSPNKRARHESPNKRARHGNPNKRARHGKGCRQ